MHVGGRVPELDVSSMYLVTALHSLRLVCMGCMCMLPGLSALKKFKELFLHIRPSSAVLRLIGVDWAAMQASQCLFRLLQFCMMNVYLLFQGCHTYRVC